MKKMTEEELKEYVIKLCKNKTPIPKPKGTTSIVNADLEENRFQYEFGRNRRKSIPFTTFFACYRKLIEYRELARKWFANEFPAEYSSSPCNFTTIGGIFVQMKIAEYGGNNSGVYRLIKNK